MKLKIYYGNGNEKNLRPIHIIKVFWFFVGPTTDYRSTRTLVVVKWLVR